MVFGQHLCKKSTTVPSQLAIQNYVSRERKWEILSDISICFGLIDLWRQILKTFIVQNPIRTDEAQPLVDFIEVYFCTPNVSDLRGSFLTSLLLNTVGRILPLIKTKCTSS